MAAPTDITLKFSEGVEIGLSGVKVTGPDGHAAPTSEPSLVEGDDTQVRVRPSQPLQPGTYQVDWHVLAKDGHPTHGTYKFTVGP
ncbi:hypothetical protein GCM10007301_33850 [Azorhizobium oxalatiphilum]|uniref:CopC domain-containing protein n=1 Tax=Azorhizobium oxalatiphilum TaxID=980631 RepID=A0A917FFP6_9HYPH|nr:hypothetical protein GCM10007301_33850 [Azorhizobium oxalatiphilum]